ncbi:hypothetical protein IHE44_0012101 [Lamprotornis superbus]|uniref:Uncharacterized protein n=1 Tax=Lamprotornis superbus TaxID=245042 RepID=A0A835NZU5_9PASS|nr:hypothetical protein IHE44_0012101 [Lamprotornis superbus]
MRGNRSGNDSILQEGISGSSSGCSVRSHGAHVTSQPTHTAALCLSRTVCRFKNPLGCLIGWLEQDGYAIGGCAGPPSGGTVQLWKTAPFVVKLLL